MLLYSETRRRLAEAAFKIVAEIDCPHEGAAEIVASALSRVGTDSTDPKTGLPQFDNWDHFLPNPVIDQDRRSKLVRQCVDELILTPNEFTEMVFDMTCTELVERVVTSRQAYGNRERAATKRSKVQRQQARQQQRMTFAAWFWSGSRGAAFGYVAIGVALIAGVCLLLRSLAGR